METRTRIAAIIIQDQKLLLLQGHGHKELWTPGGKIEEGEEDLDCLKRELKEELGVELVESKFFKDYSGPSFYTPKKNTYQRIYIASIKGIPKASAEIDNIVYLSKDDFKKKTYPMITITENEIIPDLIEAGVW